MIALVLTCRPHWTLWLERQLAKQEIPIDLVVFDDTTAGFNGNKSYWADATIIRPPNRLQMSLGEKRQMLLDHIKGRREPFAWFDDDDWHDRARLRIARTLFDARSTISVVGCRDGLFVDVESLQTRRLEYPPLIFNSAVFSPECASVPFQPLHRGEDTNWLERVCKDRTIVTSPDMQHAWMSHDGNVTGKRGSMTFEGPRFKGLDSWETTFLQNLRA